MMGGIRTVVGHLVMDKLISGRPSPISKNKSYHVMMGFAGLFVVVAVIFLLMALYQYLLVQYAPDMAALMTAGASFAIAIIAVLAGHTIRAYHRPKIDSTLHDLRSQLESALKSMEGDWEKPIRENPKTAVALSALVGYILADRIT
ncbi:MAG TPA: phage holin family protein [Alphaproteobacteria bacterium]|nr:phage holin family protein [Alphaproteobacteria bacterium]